MTRYEKIKAMTIEEMAEELKGCIRCIFINESGCFGDYDCFNGNKQWLEQEELE